MSIAVFDGITYEFEWSTAEHPTPDPGGDPWLIDIEIVWMIGNHPEVYIEVNNHALWHKLSNGQVLSEALEFWVYENEVYDPSDGVYEDW